MAGDLRTVELTCIRCGEPQRVSQRMVAVLNRLSSMAPFVCSRCAVDGKGALGGGRAK